MTNDKMDNQEEIKVDTAQQKEEQGTVSPKKEDNKKEEKKKKTVWEEIYSWIMLLITAVILAALFRGLVAEPIRVDGKSMINTLQDGEIVLVTKPRMLRGDLKRGDVVICHYPGRNEHTWRVGATMTVEINTAFVKRLVALPGDTVAILDGQMFVNDTLVEEDYIDYLPTYDYPRRMLGRDEYFVIGDNRASSHDSRSSDVGPISEKMIVGHAKWVIFPLDKIRTIQ